MSVTVQEAAPIDMDSIRAEAREDLLLYSQLSDPRYKPDVMHSFLANKLMETAHGKKRRQMFNSPPQHGKTTLCAVEYATWMLGRNPRLKIVVGSYGQTLCEKASRLARDRVNSLEFQSIFPECRPNYSKYAANEWYTTQGGGYKAVGVDKGFTGFSCLPPNTIITTQFGGMEICKLKIGEKVLSYDSKHRELRWKKITAIGNRSAIGRYRITTSRGRMVEATGEHPFFDGEKYKRADSLSSGDSLLCLVQNGSGFESLQLREVHRPARTWKSILLKKVLGAKNKLGSCWVSLQAMRSKVSKGPKALFEPMQSGVVFEQTENQTRSGMFSMRNRIRASQLQISVLWDSMCECCSRISNARTWKPVLAPWTSTFADSAARGEGFQANQTRNNQTGRMQVRDLSSDRIFGGSPHQHEHGRQPMVQPCDDVRGLSHAMAWRGEIETESDSVAMVERIREPSEVWNIAVEDTENYFANGILTHNCGLLLIDDPHKDFAEAQSIVSREHVWNWFLSVAMTRLDPESIIVIIGTRWHPDDLCGRLLNPDFVHKMEDMGFPDAIYQHYNLTAIAEESDVLGREEGESLWTKFPKEWIKMQMAVLGSHISQALYMGRPTQKGGNYIRSDDFVIVNEEDVPPSQQEMRAWDIAETAKKTSDYTAGPKGFLDGNQNLWITDMKRGQWVWPKARQTIISLAAVERILVGFEKTGNTAAFDNLKEIADVEAPEAVVIGYDVDRDKLTRALPWIALTERKKVFLVRNKIKDWIPEFLSECDEFGPGCKNDDQIDGVSLLYRMLKEGGNWTATPVPQREDSFRFRASRNRTLI